MEFEPTEYEHELINAQKVAERALAREVVNLVEDQRPITPTRAVEFAVAYAQYLSESVGYGAEVVAARQARGIPGYTRTYEGRLGIEAISQAQLGNFRGLIGLIAHEYDDWISHPVILGRFRTVLDNIPSQGLPQIPPLSANLQEGLRLDTRDYTARVRSWSTVVPR